MKKVKDWLESKVVDEKILIEIYNICKERFGFEYNTRELRSLLKNFVYNFLKQKKYNKVYLVKCDEENNPPNVLDDNAIICHIFEKINGMTTTHLIKL